VTVNEQMESYRTRHDRFHNQNQFSIKRPKPICHRT